MNLKPINVVVGIIFNTNSEIFITQRTHSADFNGYFEFPGGKVEADEALLDALLRELKEEVDLQSYISINFYDEVEYQYPHKSVKITFYSVITNDVLTALEGKNGLWITPDQLTNYEFPPAI